MRRLQTISDITNRIVTLLCAALFLVMLAITFAGSIYQAVSGEALSWTYSLARQFVPWIGFLSITVAFKHMDHISVNLIAPRLPARAALGMEYLVVALIWLFAGISLYEGIRFFLETRQLVMISDTVQFSQRWTTASAPVMGLIMLIHATTGRALLEPARKASDAAAQILADFEAMDADADVLSGAEQEARS